jgi:hypothetical protein
MFVVICEIERVKEDVIVGDFYASSMEFAWKEKGEA